ncbi:uncharacterized protein LOC117335982 [Pecten maximus]|uniref:uncharacterized protein LOC117335982 n=1 Tax=Pecten maximus TaxID=6579 RepID=UPI00145806A7|nr:uncharacterized protein LOC117335982 [Pecten maximus]
MTSIKELTEIGKDLGYKDTELQSFVKSEQARERDEREAERERKKAEADETMQLEKIRIGTAIELDKLAKERDDREEARAEREHRRKMELLQAGSAEGTNVTDYVQHQHEFRGARGPKLPSFEEGKDNIDAYIERFVRYASAQRWPQEQWGANLGALLKGRALDVFTRLSVEDSLNFYTLKKALLRRFEKTEEGFRKSFRSERPEPGETFCQFAIRLDGYLQKWVEMTNTPKTYDDLKDLMVRDQFLHCCGKDLALFLRERVPKSMQEMARFADQFAEARGTKTNVMMARPARPGDKQHNANPLDIKTNDKKGNSFAKGPVCFKCLQPGHKSFECPNKKSGNRVAGMTRTVETKGNIQTTESRAVVSKGQASVTGKGRGKRKNQGWKPMDSSSCAVDTNTPELSKSCSADLSVATSMPVVRGCIGEHFVTVLRDSGCSGVVVRRSLVNSTQMTEKNQLCSLADGSRIQVPIAEVEVDTPYLTGAVNAWVLDTPLYDLIIGNVDGARPPDQPDGSWKRTQETMLAVETRAQCHRRQQSYKPLKVSHVLDVGDVDDLKKEQQDDESLSKVRKLADDGNIVERNDGGKSEVYYHKGLLYRKFHSPKVSNGKTFRQLVVPRKFRQAVLKLAHDSIMAGHQGAKRTTNRVLTEFFWPGLQSDVVRYCRSCDVCQRTVPKGRITKAPLGSMPLIDTPFKRIAVDLVGPLQPATDRGNRYILTVVDYATRYPEAVALRGIETERVAEALVDIFSRVGVPSEMLTDQGAQFTSQMMREVSRLLSIRRLTTTPYHPMCNGLVERFNGTLKQMLRRMCSERPKDWDKYLNALLFAYREVPQESLGFSPFELLYGRTIRGPIMILKELWTKEVPDDEVKTTYQYVMDLRERLDETCELAKEQLRTAKISQRKYYNRKAKDRQLDVDDKVLILLPTKTNKLLMQWRGPYSVTAKKGPMDYEVDMVGKKKTFHVNMLKKYFKKDVEGAGSIGGVLCCVTAAVVHEDELEPECHRELESFPVRAGKEGMEDVNVSEHLATEQRNDVDTLLSNFKDVLTDKPGRTNLASHDIFTTTDDPVRVRPYPLPFHTKSIIKEEVESMLEMDVIEPSTSPYSAPVVMVKKKDGSNRFCIDFRSLNKVTVFDAEPMPNTEEIFARLAGCFYFSKLDLTKGYWQVPMTDRAKEMTAFSTPQGLFQFKVMPFGLVNAPATFSRLMRKLLMGIANVENFIDDILMYTKTWTEHLICVVLCI